MSRTTLDIDAPVLSDLKRIQKEEGKSLGRIVSEILAEAIGRRKAKGPERRVFAWSTADLGRPMVDLDDKEAVRAVLDQEERRKHRR